MSGWFQEVCDFLHGAGDQVHHALDCIHPVPAHVLVDGAQHRGRQQDTRHGERSRRAGHFLRRGRNQTSTWRTLSVSCCVIISPAGKSQYSGSRI